MNIPCQFHRDCSSRSWGIVVTISVPTNERMDERGGRQTHYLCWEWRRWVKWPCWKSYTLDVVLAKWVSRLRMQGCTEWPLTCLALIKAQINTTHQTSSIIWWTDFEDFLQSKQYRVDDVRVRSHRMRCGGARCRAAPQRNASDVNEPISISGRTCMQASVLVMLRE